MFYHANIDKHIVQTINIMGTSANNDYHREESWNTQWEHEVYKCHTLAKSVREVFFK